MIKQNEMLRVATLWHDTVVSERVVDRGAVTVGEDLGSTVVVPVGGSLPGEHTLLVPDPDGGWVLEPTAQMVGRLSVGGRESPLRAGATLRAGDWAQVDFGDLAVFAQVDAALPVAPARTLRGAVEASVLASTLGALTLHLGVLIAAFLLFEEKPQLVDLSQEDRFLRAVMDTAPMREEEKPIFEEAIAEDPGRAVDREEGAFGEPDKREPSKRAKREGDLVDRIQEAGLHRALGSKLLGRGPLKGVMGDTKGFADKLGMAMAGHDGDVVVGHGTGMGLRGTGDGGGGPGFGKVGGMGSLEGGGGGRRVATRLKTTTPTPTGEVTHEKFERAGFCKEADITRVVQARRGGVQHCYETALRSRPELQGKISVSWRIGLDGGVAAAHIESSTVADPAVASCVLRQVKRWTFPKPEGGLCQIRFPFVFNSGL